MSGGVHSTYTQAIPRIGINITLSFKDMFKPQMRKKGRIAKVKSLMTEMALYRKSYRLWAVWLVKVALQGWKMEVRVVRPAEVSE